MGMGKKSRERVKRKEDSNSSSSINTSCRYVGVGGTKITFTPTQDGVRCFWEDECGNDTSFISWSDWLFIAASAQKHQKKTRE